jgi:hypothetical protein
MFGMDLVWNLFVVWKLKVIECAEEVGTQVNGGSLVFVTV